jgi:hypothetical protein
VALPANALDAANASSTLVPVSMRIDGKITGFKTPTRACAVVPCAEDDAPCDAPVVVDEAGPFEPLRFCCCGMTD